MKKSLLFLTLGFMAFCLLPQQMFASNPEVTISGNKVTVTSTSAGSLATYVKSLTTEQKNALKVDEIVFVGKFNQSDFEALQGFPYKTVDMGEAKMVAASQNSANYKLYHNAAPPTGNKDDKCVVQGTKYVSKKLYQWNDVENPGDVTFQSSSGWTIDNVNSPEHRKDYNVNDYVKIPSAYSYYRKDAVWEEVTYPLIHEGYDADGAIWYAYTWSTANDEVWLPLEKVHSASDLKSKVIFVRMDPNASEVGWKAKWNQTEDLDKNPNQVYVITGWGGEKLQGEWRGEDKTSDGWTADNLRTQEGYANQIVIIQDKFYRYKGKKWTAITESEAQNQTIEDPTWAESEKDDHLNDNSNYVRFATDYAYYQKTETGNFTWSQEEYNDGDEVYNPLFYSDSSSMGTPSAEGQLAIVGGTIKEHDGSQWNPTGSSDNDTYNYSLMKFSYWSSTLEKAVTSKYADATISSEIFQNCKSLTEVDYKAGNVTGFNDHATTSGYAPGLKVTIGKNVTSIDASAFAKCSALQTLEFDKDYSDSNADKLDGVVYPLPLTIGNSAFLNCANLTGVEFPNRVVSIGSDAFKQAGTAVEEMTVSFERRTTDKGASIDFDHDLTIGDAAFQNCTTLKEVELPIRLTTLGRNAFQGTSNLTSVSIREDIEDARLSTIPSGAFQNSGIKELVVPRSVTLIEEDAFGSCYDLEKVTFQEQIKQPQDALVIKTKAFAGGDEYAYKLKDVYVEVDPSKRKLVCEKNAFSFISLVGQTDVTNEQRATLHFNKDNWDYYAGDWKKGLAFSQSDLNAIKDGYGNPQNPYKPDGNDGIAYIGGVPDGAAINTSTGKYETGSDATQYSPANGWQQFAVTSTGIDIIIPAGDFCRSYSVTTNFYIPVIAGTTQQLVRIFRVTGFDDGWEKGMNKNDRDLADSKPRIATVTEVKDYIPAYTGLIMVGTGTEANYLTYQKEVASGSQIQQYFYEEDTSSSLCNLLEPSNDSDIIINPTDPYPLPAEKTSGYRIFGFKPATKSFIRAKKGTTLKKNLAYLKLPVSMFHWSNEGQGNGTTGYDASANIALVIDFGETIGTDGISLQPSVTSNGSESYYTLQGQKVERPTTKGIYIYKGKKIMVK